MGPPSTSAPPTLLICSRKTLKTKSHFFPSLKYFHCCWKNCLINNTWRFTYLFITTVSISYGAAHMQFSLPFSLFLFFLLLCHLLRGFPCTLLFRCWFIRVNLDINHAAWWMMHGVLLAMSRTSKCWHHTGKWVRSTVNLRIHEMQDFRNRTVVKVGNNGLFPGQIVRGIGAPLTYLIFINSFWIST